MKYHKGMSLVEVLIGATIIVIGILALIKGFATYLTYALDNDKNVQAAYIGEEGLEVASFLRDGSWTNNINSLSTSTTYYLRFDTTNNVWIFSPTKQWVDGVFLRSFAINDVMRDGSGKIAQTGTFDPNTKFITETVQYYQGHATTTKIFSTYLANIYSN